MTMPPRSSTSSTATRKHVGAPVRTGTTVTSASRPTTAVTSSRRTAALGAAARSCSRAARTACPSCRRSRRQLPSDVRTLTANEYRNPAQLDWARRARRRRLGDRACSSPTRSTAPAAHVTLAVGEHIRMPRLYRGRDIQWWLDAVGILDERYDEVDDIVRARRVPSPQLVGSPERRDARSERADRARRRRRRPPRRRQRRPAQFSGSLAQSLRDGGSQAQSLARSRSTTGADRAAQSATSARSPSDSRRRASKRHRARARSDEGAASATIVWATGFRPDYSLAARARARPQGSLAPRRRRRRRPGSTRSGCNFMRRRKSSFIHGAEDDVRDLCAHLVQHLRSPSRQRAAPVAASRNR